MRAQIITVLALSGFLVLPGLLKGQDQSADDKNWPALGNPEIVESYVSAPRRTFSIRRSGMSHSSATRTYRPREIH